MAPAPARRARAPAPAWERHSAEGERLLALVRAQAPLRRALALLSARLVAARGWERLGFARRRDYAVERLGLSERQVQELAGTGRRLAELPGLEAELLAGRLPWTKVRLVARVASARDEAAWIALAERCTVRALEREVCAREGGAPGSAAERDEGEAEPRECLRIRCTPAVHARWWRVRWLARRVAGEALPAEACLEAVTAEALSAVGLDAAAAEALDRPLGASIRAAARAPSPRGDRSARRATAAPLGAEAGAREETEGAETPPRPADPRRHADRREMGSAAAPRFLRSLTEGLEDADAFELDARLRRALALEQRALARIGEALLAAVEARVHHDAGFRTLDAYARERLGISPRRARALLRIARAARGCPALAAAWRDGRLSWVRAHAILPVLALPEASGHAARWVEHAAAVSVRRLDEDVERALVLRESRPELFSETGGLPAREEEPERESAERAAGVPTDRHTCARATNSAAGVERSQIVLFAPREVLRLLRAGLATVRRRLERATGRCPTEGEAFGAMLSHALATWEAEQGRTRAAHRVFERDGWRCTVPGCSSYRNLHDHHLVFRSAGGSDALENRTTLCAWHHLRGVHGGVVGVAGRAPDGLRFRLGLRGDAPPLVRYGAGERIEAEAC